MQASLASTSNVLQPMIIADADKGYFLVGVVDTNNNFVGLGQNSAQVVNSIVEAKAYLRGNNVFSALLDVDSAIEDMSAPASHKRARQRILC